MIPKFIITLTAMAMAMTFSAVALPADSLRFANTIRIYPSDTRRTVIAKAAHVVPTPAQMSALENEFIAFVCFGPNTFTGKEWGSGKEDPRVFDPTGLDTDQWVRALKDAGMTMVVFTVKHHDGFVLYQSRYTDHGVMRSPFASGKGDVMKSLSESCRKLDMKLGVYLSPADLYQIESPGGLYGNGSPYTERVIPRQVPGSPFAPDAPRFRFVVDDYNEYFLNQLYELLTEYGPIHEVWFDGAHPRRKGGQTYNYAAWKQLIRTLAPEAVIFGREDVRWCGNEAGATRSTEWNVVPYAFDPDTASVFPDMTAADIGSVERLMDPDTRFLHYQQPEVDTSIREGWFYRDERQRTRSADDVFDIYERSVGGNATFILNVPPGPDGRLAERDVAVLEETGRRIRRTYGTDLLAGADAPAELLDGDRNTFVEVTDSVVITLPEPAVINRLVIQEPVHLRGERIARHAVDAWVDGGWRLVAEGTNVGYKRILRFPDVTTSRLRLRVEESRLTPAISRVSAHHYDARPPELAIERGADGLVTIAPAKSAFGWNATDGDASRRLSAGHVIRFTTDGSEPDSFSPVYTAPFAADAAIVKARSYLGGLQGPLAAEQLGMAKGGWRFEAADTTLTVILESERPLRGFAFIPVAGAGYPSSLQGVVSVSTDGIRWAEAARFDIGNLANDPVRRLEYFSEHVRARMVRIVFAGSPGRLTTQSIDLF